MKKIFLMITLLSFPLTAFTAEKKKSYLEKTQRLVSSFWSSLNYNMDSFFSNEKYHRRENRATIRASFNVYKKEGHQLNQYFDLRIKTHLPKLSRKLNLTIEKERDDMLESRSNNVTTNQFSRTSDYTASVNYLLFSTFANTEFNSGLKFDMPLDPFIKYKIYKKLNFSLVNIHIEQKFIFYRQAYLSEYTQLSFSKYLNNQFGISQSNILSWTDLDDQFVLRNSLSLGQIISSEKSITYSIGANAIFSPLFFYNKYDASISYRQVLHKKWLFGSISIGADFLKKENWDMTKIIASKVEVLF